MEIKDVENLATLARIAVTDAEKTKLLSEMNAILEYVGVINKAVSELGEKNGTVFIDDYSVNSQPTNVMREDTVTTEGGFYQRALIDAAPRHEGDYVKVKKILGGSQ